MDVKKTPKKEEHEENSALTPTMHGRKITGAEMSQAIVKAMFSAFVQTTNHDTAK